MNTEGKAKSNPERIVIIKTSDGKLHEIWERELNYYLMRQNKGGIK